MTERRPTYADIEALPEHVVGEILAGKLVVSPRPAPKHAVAASTLGALLLVPFQEGIGGPGGWWILDEPELSLGVDEDYDPVVPDLAGWKVETLPEIPDTAQIHVVPDFVCEVLSPSTARADRVLKLPFYARAGIGHAWIVDPISCTIEVFAHVDGAWRLACVAGGDDVAALEPFGAVELALARLWRSRGDGGPAPSIPDSGS